MATRQTSTYQCTKALAVFSVPITTDNRTQITSVNLSMVRNGSPSVTPRDTIPKVVVWVIRCIEARAQVVVRQLTVHGVPIENAGFIVTLQIVVDCTI